MTFGSGPRSRTWRMSLRARGLALLSSGHRVSEDDPNYLRVVVINILGVTAGVLWTIFLLRNLVLLPDTGNVARVLVDAFGVAVSAAMFAALRAGYSIGWTARTALVAITVGTLALMLARKDAQFPLLVAAMYPAFAFLLLDTIWGAAIAVVGVTVVLNTVIGLGVGPWKDIRTDRIDAVITLTAEMITLSVMMGAYVFSRRRVLGRMRTLQDRLMRESVHDALTGLYNRRQFETVLERELARAHRIAHGLAVFMIDIDHFKAYNDHYGHPAGDEVLVAVASALSQCFTRTDDILFRIGGEEFCAVFSVDHQEDAAAMADAALANVEALALPSPGDADRGLTISGGLAYIPDGKGLDPQMVYSRADRALYRAKRAGRAQWMLAMPEDDDAGAVRD